MQPDSGGRLEARLRSSDASGACYAVELSTAAGVWQSDVLASLASGDASWQGWSGPGAPPEWLCRYLRAALRSAWRARAEEGWARRLTRWREAPEARRSASGEPGEPASGEPAELASGEPASGDPSAGESS